MNKRNSEKKEKNRYAAYHSEKRNEATNGKKAISRNWEKEARQGKITRNFSKEKKSIFESETPSQSTICTKVCTCIWQKTDL